MDDPDATRPQYWREVPYDLVRPYVGGPDQEMDPAWDFLAEGDEATPEGEGYYPAPPPPPTAGLEGLLGPGRRPGRHSRPSRPEQPNRTSWADRTDENPTRLLVAQPGPNRSRRHAKSPRPGPAAPPTDRRRSLAILAVAGIAAAGLALFFVLPSNLTSSKGTPAPPRGGIASATSSGRAPSLADGGYGSMSTSAGHAAASPSPSRAASRTAKPTSTVAPSSPPPSAAASAAGGPSLSPGSLISIEATTACCRTFSIAHASGDNQVVITQVTTGSSTAARAAATWVVRQGLADGACVSFESADAPGEYLMHHDFELFLNPNDGSTDFAQDATFCAKPGNSGEGYSFEAFNRPSMFIRHFDFVGFIASDGGSFPWDATNLWHHDTSWTLIQPWS